MILKESFRYQNYLTELIDSSISYLTSLDNIMTKKQEHLRSKANIEAENETIIVSNETEKNYTPNQVIDFMLDVLEEKEGISSAISDAKLSTEINIDSAIANNKEKQRIAYALERISKIESSEKIVKGSDYKFNNEGNQNIYYYDIKEINTINFDRNKVKGAVKNLRKVSDNTSNELDKIQVTLEVDYLPMYDVNDNFEDAIEVFIENN